MDNVELTFNSLDCHKKYPAVDHFFLELCLNGRPVRIDIGVPTDPEDPDRRLRIHVNGPVGLAVDARSINACDIRLPDEPKEAR